MPEGNIPMAERRAAIDQALIDEIVRRVLSVASPVRIIMFGSAATGQMTRDSDIDLLVVQPSPAKSWHEYVRIHNALRGLGCAFDVILIATGQFEETKGLIGGIAYPAHRHGRVIYEAA